MKIRPIEAADEDQVVSLLVEGFPSRTRDYWRIAFNRLATQAVPSGQMQFGGAMEEAGKLVGVLLVIWTPSSALPAGQMRANLSSWYVKPAFRSFAAMLLAKMSRSAAITYLNVSAAAHTAEICTALGFKKYSSGQSVSVPILSYSRSGGGVLDYRAGVSGLKPDLDNVMLKHVEMGCLAYVGQYNGQPSPFLFVRRRVQGIVPAAQLVFCENIEAFLHCAPALGRALFKKGVLFVISDSSGPIPIRASLYFDGKVPKYYKGPDVPRHGDLSFTEIPVFGI